MQGRNYTYDAATLLKDAGAVTADGAGTVSSAAKIWDAGAARFEAVAVIDVTAIDVSSTDENYLIQIQGSNSASFASGIVALATLQLGDDTTLAGDADSVVGRYELPVINEQNGTTYRYIRVYHDVTGTTPSINYTAFMGAIQA